jgi:hypothetical protein
MSSFPQHEKNLKNLKELGFDVSDYDEDMYESWGYDELVYLISDIVDQIKSKALKESE